MNIGTPTPIFMYVRNFLTALNFLIAINSLAC